MPPAPAQLPLPLAHPPHYGRDSFLVGRCNSAALRLIERWPDWPAPLAVLSGPPGSGKTHLAHIWAERSGADIVAASAIGASVAAPARSLAIEDLDPDAVPERALFHLINTATEARVGLLITARASAALWRVALPDLRSRLRLAAAADLGAPDDDLLRQVLVKLFADRQLTIERLVLDYLLLRMERSFRAAAELVDRLDRMALASGRPITRPLAAELLAGMGPAGEEFTETK